MEDQEQNNQEELTKHEKKELKKQEKSQEKQEHHESKSKKETQKSVVKYSIGIIVVLLVIFGGYYFIIKPIKGFDPILKGPYHWHANFDISVCGEPAQVRCGAGMCGQMAMHHHNDNTIHIEGNSIARQEDIALGKFFDGLNIQFSDTQILDKKNGDLCSNGNPGTVKMYVNGQTNNEFDKYILKKCESKNIKQDCEKIEIKFE